MSSIDQDRPVFSEIWIRGRLSAFSAARLEAARIALAGIAAAWLSHVVWSSGASGVVGPLALALICLCLMAVCAGIGRGLKRSAEAYQARRLGTGAFLRAADRQAFARHLVRALAVVLGFLALAGVLAFAFPGRAAAAVALSAPSAVAFLRLAGLAAASRDKTWSLEALIPDAAIAARLSEGDALARFRGGWTRAGRLSAMREALALGGVDPRTRDLAMGQYAPETVFAPVSFPKKPLAGELRLTAGGWRLASTGAFAAVVLTLAAILFAPPGSLGRLPPLEGLDLSGWRAPPAPEPPAEEAQEESAPTPEPEGSDGFGAEGEEPGESGSGGAAGAGGSGDEGGGESSNAGSEDAGGESASGAGGEAGAQEGGAGDPAQGSAGEGPEGAGPPEPVGGEAPEPRSANLAEGESASGEERPVIEPGAGEGRDPPPQNALFLQAEGVAPQAADAEALRIGAERALFAEPGAAPDAIEARFFDEASEPSAPQGEASPPRQVLPAWIHEWVK